jgi:hypothetical protein
LLTAAPAVQAAVFGGQLGYRWQSGQSVFGLEGQGDWANLSGCSISPNFPAFSTGVKVDAPGLITGQIGYAWNASLFYLKGGAATTRNRFDIWTDPSRRLGGQGKFKSLGWYRWASVRNTVRAELVIRYRIRPLVHG